MKTKQVLYMIKIGWNFQEIRELCQHSKEIERQLVLRKQYDNKYKIVDFSNVIKYYCSKCNCYHRKYRYEQKYGKKIRVKTESFKKCKDTAYTLSDSETFSKQFRKSFNSYSIDKHKKMSGSRKQ